MWEILSEPFYNKNSHNRYVKAKCQCGKIKNVRLDNIERGLSTHCRSCNSNTLKLIPEKIALPDFILSHAAGIFETSGSILLGKNYLGKKIKRKPRVRLILCKKKWAVLDHLLKFFGGTITNYSEDRKYWTVVDSAACSFLISIKPYVRNQIRVKQIEIIEEYIQHYYIKEDLKKLSKLYSKLKKTYEKI